MERERTDAIKWTSWKERKSKTNRKEELKRKEEGNELHVKIETKEGSSETSALKRKEEVHEEDGKV